MVERERQTHAQPLKALVERDRLAELRRGRCASSGVPPFPCDTGPTSLAVTNGGAAASWRRR